MHYQKVKGILSAYNGMNIYRGCQHGCIYCDSRSKCYHIDHVFEDVEVKENALELLETALKKKRQKCMIGTGSMTDSYTPVDRKIQYTRKALSIIDKYGFGVAIQTKSKDVLRDLDILKSINTHSKAIVQMTLTTFDEQLCKLIEPNVSTTKERFDVLMKLHEEGIETIVWLSPILPFINDTEENLLGILDYCAKAHVKGIICFGMGLTLREGNREYFYEQLDKHFPGLTEKYFLTYSDQYEVTSRNNAKLMKLFHSFCQEHLIMHDNDQIFEYMRKYEAKKQNEQLTLF